MNTTKFSATTASPMTFTAANGKWEALANWLPSRHISVEKHAALNQMIDDSLDLQVIQPLRRGHKYIGTANQLTSGVSQ